jgi:DNA helicase-2/ATP-dependent DNA helicase PcrA
VNYKQLKVSSENIEREKEVMKNILTCINEGKGWFFDAGAGAGKTYALVQTLKEIIIKKGESLKNHNQKVLCITYTNVAADEIKERVGATNLIEVSTIHDCVWNIIAPYRKELVEIHREKILSSVVDIEVSLNKEGYAEKYRSLNDDSRSVVIQTINGRITEYYKYKSSKAAEFRRVFTDIDNDYPNLLSNIGNFTKTIDNLLRVQRYKKAIEKIDKEIAEFSIVKYDTRFNYDRLDKMSISHDTLLEYTFNIVSQNDLLKRIICDQYPFVLVDEYQDTSVLVVNTLSTVDEYAKRIKHPFAVGYYGDVKQSIYNSGVGSGLKENHNGLDRVEKVFNRRCSSKIISTANKIRNDGLIQESIYENFFEGNVEFYNSNEERKEFISVYLKKWKINNKNKLHCFELTNEKVAEQSGFSELYNFFKNSKWYKNGTNYQFLNNDVLNQNEVKLGIVQKLFFRIIDFKNKVNRDSSMIFNIFQESHLKDIDIETLRKIVKKVQDINGITFGGYIKSLFSNFRKGDDIYDKCIEYILAEDLKSFKDIKQFVLDILYYFSGYEDYSDEDVKSNKEAVDNFFKIKIKTLDVWYSFITDSIPGKVLYHTYHGTKGKEYDNVIVFLNSKFGNKQNYFSDLFNVLTDKNETGERGTDIEAARNLLYVVVTRAVKNLCIVYFDDIKEFKTQIEEVFGEISYNF